MTESFATRQATRSMDRDRDLLAREAQDIADTLTRFAKDVDQGIASGQISQVMQAMQQLHERAARYEATKQVMELYEAERAADHTEK